MALHIATASNFRRPRFPDHPLKAIRGLDYTILFARDAFAMRDFYEKRCVRALLLSWARTGTNIAWDATSWRCAGRGW
jgi:hypothetical protein